MALKLFCGVYICALCSIIKLSENSSGSVSQTEKMKEDNDGRPLAASDEEMCNQVYIAYSGGVDSNDIRNLNQ